MNIANIYDDSIRGIDGAIIEPGDTVLYTNNPFCKPSKVERIINFWIYTSDGCGEAQYFKLITKANNTLVR